MNLLGGKGRPALKADNLTAICEPIVYKMWEPRRLTSLWPFTASYRDIFTFLPFTEVIEKIFMKPPHFWYIFVLLSNSHDSLKFPNWAQVDRTFFVIKKYVINLPTQFGRLLWNHSVYSYKWT
jgi:hypothetical protein